MLVSLKFSPKGPHDIKTALVQIKARRRIRDKPLSEPMMVCFLDAYMHHSASVRLGGGCRQPSVKSLYINITIFHLRVGFYDFCPDLSTVNCCALFCCGYILRSWRNRRGFLLIFYRVASDHGSASKWQWNDPGRYRYDIDSTAKDKLKKTRNKHNNKTITKHATKMLIICTCCVMCFYLQGTAITMLGSRLESMFAYWFH